MQGDLKTRISLHKDLDEQRNVFSFWCKENLVEDAESLVDIMKSLLDCFFRGTVNTVSNISFMMMIYCYPLPLREKKMTPDIPHGLFLKEEQK